MQKLKFIQSPLRHNLAFAIGEIADIPDPLAKILTSEGLAYMVESVEQLPDDLPARLILAENGFTSLQQIAEIDDLTQLRGIGKGIAPKIKQYLSKHV